MSDQRGSNMLVQLLGMVLGLYAIFSVMLTDGNSISELCRILMAGGFLFCALRPRAGLFVWLISSGYMDLLKRLMVSTGRISQMDLYFVLGIHPMMMAGLCVGVVLGALTGRVTLGAWHFKRLLAAVAIMLLAGLAAAREKGMSLSSILPEIANNGFYAVLIFLVPVLLPSLQDVLRTLRMLVIAYIPVAIYGIYQQYAGFQDFEIEYLMTGLSIEIKQLLSDEVRAFSTLNSPTALGFASGACFTFALILGGHRDQSAARFHFPRAFAIALALLFVASWLSSTARSAVVVIPVALLSRYCFSDAKRTRAFYILAVSGFVLLVASSGWLLKVLPNAMDTMFELAGGQGFADQILRVGTYYERLMGFSNVLANPAAYTLRGMGADRGGDYNDEFMNHDPLSGTLVRYGVVVLVFMITVTFFLLRHVHSSVLKLPKGSLRNVGCLLLSVPLAYLVASVLQGTVFFTFPLNAFTWLCMGMVDALGQEKAQPVQTTVAHRPRIQHVPQGCHPGRFRPVSRA
ncbi:MAG: hypothetical protein R3F13_05740 [Prosthecobacter sp.]